MGSEVITLETKAARKLYRARDVQPSAKLCNWYSPGGEVKLITTDDEMEWFEQESGHRLDADVIDDPHIFRRFVLWLRENCKLRVFP
jgi:hypothetical protein